MAKIARTQAAPVLRSAETHQPPCGSVLACMPYAGELARHRIISADGVDCVVATLHERHRALAYLTGAYPVVRGYLVMVRQPLYEMRSADAESARREHEQLVRVLAEAGVRVVRARRALAARQRAEREESAQSAVRRAALGRKAAPSTARHDPVDRQTSARSAPPVIALIHDEPAMALG